jgi:hypothetical protein
MRFRCTALLNETTSRASAFPMTSIGVPSGCPDREKRKLSRGGARDDNVQRLRQGRGQMDAKSGEVPICRCGSATMLGGSKSKGTNIRSGYRVRFAILTNLPMDQ